MGGDSEHWSDLGVVSNLGSDSWMPHLGAWGASSRWHDCLERKRTKILNESPLIGFRTDPCDTWSDSVDCSIAASDFLAGHMGLVIFKNYFNQTNSQCTPLAMKNPFQFWGNLLDLPDVAWMIVTAWEYLHNALSWWTGNCFTYLCYQNLSLLLGYSDLHQLPQHFKAESPPHK